MITLQDILLVNSSFSHGRRLLETNLLISDGLNDAYWHGIDKGDHLNEASANIGPEKRECADQCDEESPDWKICVPYFDSNDSKTKHSDYNYHQTRRLNCNRIRTENDTVPPFGNLRISRHQPSMNIRLLIQRSFSLNPKLFSEV